MNIAKQQFEEVSAQRGRPPGIVVAQVYLRDPVNLQGGEAGRPAVLKHIAPTSKWDVRMRYDTSQKLLKIETPSGFTALVPESNILSMVPADG